MNSYIFVLLILSLSLVKAGTTVEEIQYSTVNEINQLRKGLSDIQWQLVAKHEGGPEVKLVTNFREIANTLDSKALSIDKVRKGIIFPTIDWGLVEGHCESIEGQFVRFKRMLNSSTSQLYLNYWLEFARTTILSTDSSILQQLKTLQSLIIGEEHPQRPNVFLKALKEMDSYSNLCNIKQSQQQLIYNLFNSLQMIQLKGYTIVQFSWMILKSQGEGNFTKESKLFRESYLKRIKQQTESAQKAMVESKRKMWRCDPQEHVSGITYTEFTKLLQGFVINEVDLSPEKKCFDSCGEYNLAKQNHRESGLAKSSKECSGHVLNCEYIDSDMWICPEPSYSHRRYKFIKYENGRVIGQISSCPNEKKVDSWWWYLVFHCSYCFCKCDDSNDLHSDRFVSLNPVLSDYKNNKVITGLKFVKVQRVLHLQIQEGELLPKGAINESTVAWKEVESFNIRDAKQGINYHKLTWNERSIDLDDHIGPNTHLLTGVKFRTIGNHLNLEVLISRFDFETGKLNYVGDGNVWLGNENTDVSESPRTRIKLDNPDIPTRRGYKATPISKTDSFLEFTSSSKDRDAAQSTVPFIDIQAVAAEPPVPLTGAGIYYKSSLDSGGFVAPRIFTYDFSQHIQGNTLKI